MPWQFLGINHGFNKIKKRELPVLFLLALLLRLSLLNFNAAEYSDAIHYMTFSFDKAHYNPQPPLYPIFIAIFRYFFSDPELGGKLISIVAGSLTVFPIFYMGSLLFNRTVSALSVILYLFSPFVMKYDIRVMTEALFTFLFILTTYGLLKYLTLREARSLSLATFASGLCVLTRWHGLVFIPLLGLGYWQYFRHDNRKQHPKTDFFFLAFSFLPWLFFVLWFISSGFTQPGMFDPPRSWKDLLTGWMNIETYAMMFPYFLTYPIFITGLYGFIKATENRQSVYNRYLALSLYFLGTWFIIHAFWRAWSLRFFLPLLPLWILSAAYGLYILYTSAVADNQKSRVRYILTLLWILICILYPAVFTGISLYLQKDTFGDFKRTAQLIRETPSLKDQTILSDDVDKTAFWAQTKILPYDRTIVQVGHYVVLHSFYSNIPSELQFLNSRYVVTEIYQTTAQVVPLTEDILRSLSLILADKPIWTLLRYEPQPFQSVILKIEKRRDSWD
jgi:4-amino-4-deoxy-L-arabinose transferase-like glycosyltransferase